MPFSEIEWRAKIAAKLVLSRLPIPYRLWKQLGVFVQGRMDDAAYSSGVVRTHLNRAGFAEARGFTYLEIGPGDSVAGAMLAKASGAASGWLVDTDDRATRNMNVYRSLTPRLGDTALLDESAFQSRETLLAACGARYLTGGLASLRAIPSASVDFIWSQAVLEHVRTRDFDRLLAEMRRILRPHGVSSHWVDLRDHLGGALNNLRFSERLWESDFMARSGFYTNRLRFSELLRRFGDAGFAVEVTAVDRWAALPTQRAALATPFRDLPEDELCVSGFNVLLCPA